MYIYKHRVKTTISVSIHSKKINYSINWLIRIPKLCLVNSYLFGYTCILPNFMIKIYYHPEWITKFLSMVGFLLRRKYISKSDWRGYSCIFE